MEIHESVDNVRIQSKRPASEMRAMQLLGSGLGPSAVALAVGVTESRISQLMSQEDFRESVSKLRFESLNKHNEMDVKYDVMEDKLLKKLEEQLPLMQKPMEILRTLQVINAAKRRGQSAPEQLTQQNQVVSILMPTSITQKFTTNINNQVILAGDQTLETIQSNTLLRSAKTKMEGLHNALPGQVFETTERAESISDPRSSPENNR